MNIQQGNKGAAAGLVDPEKSSDDEVYFAREKTKTKGRMYSQYDLKKIKTRIELEKMNEDHYEISYSSDDTVDLIDEANKYASVDHDPLENLQWYLNEPRYHNKEFRASNNKNSSERDDESWFVSIKICIY